MSDRDRRAWNEPEPLYSGQALTDLHHPNGTAWVKDPVRGYWPNCCDQHRPESKRVGKAAVSPRNGPGRTKAPKPGNEPPVPEELDETTVLKLLATWIRKARKETK